jgi:acyl-CoA hydrolase
VSDGIHEAAIARKNSPDIDEFGAEQKIENGKLEGAEQRFQDVPKNVLFLGSRHGGNLLFLMVRAQGK